MLQHPNVAATTLGRRAASIVAALLLSCAGANAMAQTAAPASSGGSDAADLANKIANPIAALIQVPFQLNYDRGLGANEQGSMTYLKFQPVVPIAISNDMNYIVRAIVPYEWMRNVDGYTGSGVGQVEFETFFSPRGSDEFVWGIGPYLAFPATSPQLGSKQWGAGVSFAAIWRPKPWTMGALLYQSWNAGGSAIGGTTNNTYWQPFVAYVTRDAWTFTLNTESTFNWDSRRTSNPMNFIVSKLVYLDKMPVSLSVGARYYLTSVPGGAEGWGARASVSFVFPE